MGRGQPPPRLPLGADTVVISALPQLPPPPWLVLPSCVKTPAAAACWRCTPGLGLPGLGPVSSICCGKAGWGEWVADRQVRWDLWPENRPQFPAWLSHRPAACVALSTWRWDSAVSHSTKYGLQAVHGVLGTELREAPSQLGQESLRMKDRTSSCLHV